MNEHTPPPGAASKNHSHGSDYLYHRQKTNPTAFRSANRRPPDLSHRSHTGIKTFFIVLASMVVFLLLVLFISKKTWQMKQEARIRAIPPKLAATGTPVDLEKKRVETVGLLAGLNTSDLELLNEATLLMRRGDLLQAAGQWEQAVQMYNEALRFWPDLNAARVQLGQLYLRRRLYDKAADVLEAALRNDPDSPALLNDLAVACFYQRRVLRALELLDAAVQYEPDYAPAHFNRALCLLLNSDAVAAREALDRYLALVPGDEKGTKEKAYLEAREGRYAQAYVLQTEALARRPDWVPLQLDAAAVAALMNEPHQAWSHLERAASNAPPAVILRTFREPAFSTLRQTDKGKAFEKRLEDQCRIAPSSEEAPVAWDALANEPLLSAPASARGQEEK